MTGQRAALEPKTRRTVQRMKWFNWRKHPSKPILFTPGMPGIVANYEAMVERRIRQRLAECDADKVNLEMLRNEVKAEVDRLLIPWRYS